MTAVHPRHPATAMMAGFIAWLAVKRLPEQQEQTVLQEIEAFVRWQHSARPDPGPSLTKAGWRYLNERRRDGAGDVDQRTTWTAIQLLITYDERHHRCTTE